MTDAEIELAVRRRERDAARIAFERQVATAKTDLAPASLKTRLIGDVKHKSLELATEAVEIANDSRGVLVGTAAALALWLARKPIGRAIAGAWDEALAGTGQHLSLDRVRQILGAGLANITTEDDESVSQVSEDRRTDPR